MSSYQIVDPVKNEVLREFESQRINENVFRDTLASARAFATSKMRPIEIRGDINWCNENEKHQEFKSVLYTAQPYEPRL